MIKRIELVNFMSHAHTVIEPADGLTVLVGPNNCGKSAVMSALQVLCHNDSSTYVTRHGEKECSIRVTTDDGQEVVWSRNRNAAKYEINGTTYDRLRGKVPEALYEALRLPKVELDQSAEEFDIHFGNQKKPVFLLNESGRAAAGFFAASSDASRLIEMQKLHKQRVLDAKRDLTRLETDTKDIESQIEFLAPLPAIQKLFDVNVALANEIDNRKISADRIRDLLSKVSKLTLTSGYLGKRSDALDELNQPPEIAPTKVLRELATNIKTDSRSAEYLAGKSKALDPTSAPPEIHATKKLSKMLGSLRKLQTGNIRYTRTQDLLVKTTSPPKLDSIGDLRRLVSEIRGHQKAVAMTAKAEQAARKLATPPPATQQDPLREIIRKCRELQAQMDAFTTEIKPLESQSLELDKQIESFTASNPVCQTCNQPLSSKQILKSVKGEQHAE